MRLGAPEQETHTPASDWGSWPLGHSSSLGLLARLEKMTSAQFRQATPCPPCPR